MWRSILLKEWLKIRWFLAAALIVNLGFSIKIFLDIRSILSAEHAQMVWYQAVHLHTVFHHDMRYVPLLTGLTLAAAQFFPEILGRRMRIALHLPMARDGMMFFCLAFGLGVVGAIFLVDALFIHLTMRAYFPFEVAVSAVMTALPWFLAGVWGYLGAVAVLLETAWPRRVFFFLVFSVLIAMLYSGVGYGWLTPALPWLGALLLPAFLCVFESARRFQRGGA